MVQTVKMSLPEKKKKKKRVEKTDDWLKISLEIALI